MGERRESAARRAAEAFGVLGNEIRTTILLELADDGPVSFSELRERTGVADSGRFNYHLETLKGEFVRQGESGYRLGYHGHRVARAVLAGTFTETASFDPIPVEGTCLACGEASLQGWYRDERISIGCRACEVLMVSVPFPPTAVVDRTPAEAIGAFERWSRGQAALHRDGVCPECASRVRTVVDDDPPEGLGLSPVARHTCVVCEREGCTAVGAAVLDHPEVVAFVTDVGSDPRTGPYWSNPYLLTNRHVTVRSRDPWRVDVTFERDDERLVVTVDGELAVVETTIE